MRLQLFPKYLGFSVSVRHDWVCSFDAYIVRGVSSLLEFLNAWRSYVAALLANITAVQTFVVHAFKAALVSVCVIGLASNSFDITAVAEFSSVLTATKLFQLA